MVDEVRKSILEPNQLKEVACYINDQAFTDASLAILDDWTRSGVVPQPSAGGYSLLIGILRVI